MDKDRIATVLESVKQAKASRPAGWERHIQPPDPTEPDMPLHASLKWAVERSKEEYNRLKNRHRTAEEQVVFEHLRKMLLLDA